MARPLTEPRSSLGTELFTRITVELKPQPTPNFKGRRMPISRGHNTVDLQICQSRRLIRQPVTDIEEQHRNTALYFQGKYHYSWNTTYFSLFQPSDSAR